MIRKFLIQDGDGGLHFHGSGVSVGAKSVIQVPAVACLGLLSATCNRYEKDRLHPWPYNKGLRRNFEEVFGRK